MFESLLDSALNEYDQMAKDYSVGAYVVQPSVPVLWFGDLDAYLASPLRVITVGLNPSDAEFCDGYSGSWHCRFPLAASLHEVKELATRRTMLRNALNAYFRTNPYEWFRRGFEPVLGGIGVSYSFDSSEPPAVLHTDLCTPLATSPKWSDLKMADRQALQYLAKSGSRLWNQLVVALRPNIILTSVGEEWLRYMEIDPDDDQEELGSGAFTFWARLPKSDSSTLVLREPRITSPYRSLSDASKRELGKTVFGLYRAGTSAYEGSRTR